MESLPVLTDKHRKLLRSLHQRRHRDEENCFLAEGPTLVREALRSGYEIELVVVRTDKLEEFSGILATCRRRRIECHTCGERAFEQISDAASPQGILALLRYAQNEIGSAQRIIALDGIQDPGNAGTIIRTAHFFGFDAVLLGDKSADRYNPKLVRSTMGSLFHLPVISAALPETLQGMLLTHRIFGAAAHGADDISQCAVQLPMVLVIGAEAAGISAEISVMLHQPFTIPGADGAESLNAAVAAGISMYHFAKTPRS